MKKILLVSLCTIAVASVFLFSKSNRFKFKEENVSRVRTNKSRILANDSTDSNLQNLSLKEYFVEGMSTKIRVFSTILSVPESSVFSKWVTSGKEYCQTESGYNKANQHAVILNYKLGFGENEENSRFDIGIDARDIPLADFYISDSLNQYRGYKEGKYYEVFIKEIDGNTYAFKISIEVDNLIETVYSVTIDIKSDEPFDMSFDDKPVLLNMSCQLAWS